VGLFYNAPEPTRGPSLKQHQLNMKQQHHQQQPQHSSAAGLEEASTRLDVVAFPLRQPVELLRRHREHRLKLRPFQVALHTATYKHTRLI